MPSSTRHIVFAANNGAHDLNKGFDLLRVALEDFAFADIKLHIVGDVWRGKASGELKSSTTGLSPALKSFANCIPMRASFACLPGLRCLVRLLRKPWHAAHLVAFRVSGLTGVVDHNVTGLLANPLSPEDLRTAIAAALNRWPKSRITQNT